MRGWRFQALPAEVVPARHSHRSSFGGKVEGCQAQTAIVVLVLRQKGELIIIIIVVVKPIWRLHYYYLIYFLVFDK